ncbi:MAG: hypothetical protein IT433_09195 [Phycisphaerales bacterium]|nr:hypothetical protein [Phycisphaerales bacterium]
MSSEEQVRKVKVIVACVIGVLALGLLAWQVPKFFASPVVLDDSNLPPEVIADREDLAMLKALDLPSLQAEVARREAAMRSTPPGEAQSAAMSAYARATDELATRPRN